jgi:hypothetical protein
MVAWALPHVYILKKESILFLKEMPLRKETF